MEKAGSVQETPARPQVGGTGAGADGGQRTEQCKITASPTGATAAYTARRRQPDLVMPFNYNQDFRQVDFRQHPELYRVGKGEQGVLLVQPYKSEILPFWRFRDPAVARESSERIYGLFLAYLAADDFVGADMARKFLQMGFTRARRYANHRGGNKYEGPVPADKKGQSGAHGRPERPRDPEDPVKAEAAAIFKARWDEAKQHPDYLRQKAEFEQRYGK